MQQEVKTMFRQLNHSVVVRAVALVAAFASLGGCSLNTDVSQNPAGLYLSGGDNQSAAINTALPNPLQVLVVNQFGEALEGITVNWSITAGGGSLSANVTRSDASGITQVSYTTGPTAGPAKINAQVKGMLPLNFDATITP